MSVYLVTYANNTKRINYCLVQNILHITYPKADIKGHYKYSKSKIIDDEFYKLNKSIFEQKKGDGLWLWKPYIIYKTLLDENIKEGDYVYYQDCYYDLSGFQHSVIPVIEFMKHNNLDILPGFQENSDNIHFTKGLLKSYFTLGENFFSKSSICASPIFVKKTENSIKIIKHWLDLCSVYDLISKVKIEPKIQHNYDMSILNCVLYHYNIRPIDKIVTKKESKRFNLFIETFSKEKDTLGLREW